MGTGGRLDSLFAFLSARSVGGVGVGRVRGRSAGSASAASDLFQFLERLSPAVEPLFPKRNG